MRKLIRDHKYEEAVETGRKFLAEKPENKWAARVAELTYQADVEWTLKKDSLDDYSDFEARHQGKDDPLFRRVRKAHAKLYYEEITLAARTIPACQEFRQKFPDSALVADSWTLEYLIDWEAVLKARTPEECVRHRETYPKSAHLAASWELEAELVYPSVAGDWTIVGVVSFLDRFGKTTYASQKRGEACQGIWKVTRDEHRFLTYVRFAKELVACPEAKLAVQGQELVALQIAQEMNTWAGWKVFRTLFPQSRHAELADEKMRRLLDSPHGPYPDRILLVEPHGVFRQSETKAMALVQAFDRQGMAATNLTDEDFAVRVEGDDTYIRDLWRPGNSRSVDLAILIEPHLFTVDSASDWARILPDWLHAFSGAGTTVSFSVCIATGQDKDCYPSKGGLGGDIAGLAKFLRDSRRKTPGQSNLLGAVQQAGRRGFSKNSIPVTVVILSSLEAVQVGLADRDPTELAAAVQASGSMLYLISPVSTSTGRWMRDAGGTGWGAADETGRRNGLARLAHVLVNSYVLRLESDSVLDPVAMVQARGIRAYPRGLGQLDPSLPPVRAALPAYSPMAPVARATGWEYWLDDPAADSVAVALVATPDQNGFAEAFSTLAFLFRQFQGRISLQFKVPLPPSLLDLESWPQSEELQSGRALLCLQHVLPSQEALVSALGCAAASRGDFVSRARTCLGGSDGTPGTAGAQFDHCLDAPEVPVWLKKAALDAWFVRQHGPSVTINGEGYTGELQRKDLLTWLCHRLTWESLPEMCPRSPAPPQAERPPLQ
jgi:hypothetical protein